MSSRLLLHSIIAIFLVVPGRVFSQEEHVSNKKMERELERKTFVPNGQWSV